MLTLYSIAVLEVSSTIRCLHSDRSKFHSSATMRGFSVVTSTTPVFIGAIDVGPENVFDVKISRVDIPHTVIEEGAGGKTMYF